MGLLISFSIGALLKKDDNAWANLINGQIFDVKHQQHIMLAATGVIAIIIFN